jgi:hypothetical protein
MTDELATPQTCAVKDLSVGDQIRVKDFDGPRVVRGGTKISADTMELKLEDGDGRIEVADFKLNEEVTVVAKNVTNSKAAKGKTKKTSGAKPVGAAKSKEKIGPKAAAATATSPGPKKAAQDSAAKKMSAIDAAAKVLGEASEPMNCQELIKAMGEKGYWTSPGGKTPHATLYSAILREIQTKGNDARFKKRERGKFAVARSKE